MLRQAFGARAKHGAQPWYSLHPSKAHRLCKVGVWKVVWEGGWAKHEASGVGKRTDKSLRKSQSENIHCGSTVWRLTGQSSGPAQEREGKSW